MSKRASVSRVTNRFHPTPARRAATDPGCAAGSADSSSLLGAGDPSGIWNRSPDCSYAGDIASGQDAITIPTFIHPSSPTRPCARSLRADPVSSPPRRAAGCCSNTTGPPPSRRGPSCRTAPISSWSDACAGSKARPSPGSTTSRGCASAPIIAPVRSCTLAGQRRCARAFVPAADPSDRHALTLASVRLPAGSMPIGRG